MLLPLLLLHYIEIHGYVPPAEYLAAVEKLTPETPFDGEVFYRKKLIGCGWFANRTMS
ncbi:hypothetical protein ACS7SF_22890 (plasmid) [Ralstonia sp. 25C]|uniref:hypothetical protein n=1 Tax=Ralstonia sp. 25C TaxID=3447363 RepID=UPI003F74C72C